MLSRKYLNSFLTTNDTKITIFALISLGNDILSLKLEIL